MNGNIPGYDIEREYAVVLNTIEEERRLHAEEAFDPRDWRGIARSYAMCFKGANLVCGGLQ